MAKTILITGASSGFGSLAAHKLARAGHTVYATMRETDGRNAPAMAAVAATAERERIDLRVLELDVSSQESVDAAIAQVTAVGALDVIVHNAGHMVLGPAEAFTPEQYAHLFDVNVLGTQRVNRAALPHLRAQGSGLLVWVGSSSTRGGCPPFLAPYFAAKAAMDALAVSYAAEVIRFGIDTTIVVPGAYPSGTNHFAHAGTPDDRARAGEYEATYGQLQADLGPRLTAIFPEGHDASAVADEIARVIDLPRERRPFRTHIDPSRDGSEVVSAVADRIRAEFFHRADIADLLPAQASL